MRILVLFLLAALAIADNITVTVGANECPECREIATNYVSLSMEVHDGLIYLGNVTAPNAAFRNLMQTLQSESGQRGPSIRIGGNSADQSVYYEGTGPLPPNQTYAITRNDLLALRALNAWNGFAVVDTNFFFQNSTVWISNHVGNITAVVGWDRIEGVEVGNEVEIYHDSGYRPKTWTFDNYEAEFEAHVAAAEGAGMPHGRIQGAVFCCHDPPYDDGFANYTLKYARRGDLASVSHHHYAVGGCEGSTVTLPELLNSTAGTIAYLQTFAAGASAAGVPFRVGEGNSVSCGGRAGVSDVFGTALWSVETLLALAAVSGGVNQFNFHGGPQKNSHYSPIAFPDWPKSTVPAVRPLFYGMWLVTAATANASVVWSSAVQSSNAAITAHVLRDKNGVMRVVVVHKDLAATASAANVVVVFPGAPDRDATLMRLLADGNNATATNGVTWNGQTFDGSADGLPVGDKTPETVAQDNGSFAFSMPPRSVALLVI